MATDSATYEAWFRAKVLQALDSNEADVAHEEVEAEFSSRRGVGTKANSRFEDRDRAQ